MKKNLLTKKKIHSTLHFNALIKKGLIPFMICLNSFCVMATVTTCENYGNGEAEKIVYKVNGITVPALSGNVSSGDQVDVCFTISDGSDSTIFSLVSYKAPSASFDPSTAHLQTVFDMHSRILWGADSFCLSIIVPDCYFQVDFVKGCVIYQLGPQGSGNFYTTQNRLIASATGGTDACKCVDNADAGADTSLDCITGQVILHGSTYTHDPIISWQAINGGNIVSGGNTLNPLVDAAGTYILSITDTLNCTAKDTVIVTEGSFDVDLGSDTTLCGCIELNAGPGTFYDWCSGEEYRTITVCKTGVYCVTVTNGDCVASDTIVVTIYPPPIVDLGNDTTVISCEESLTLDAGNHSIYLWNTGVTTQTIKVNMSGTYFVDVMDTTGCSASDTIHVIIIDTSIDVDLGPDTMLVSDSLILDAGNTGASFLWNTGETTQMITVTTPGTYYVTVTNMFGCMASDTIHISGSSGISGNFSSISSVNVYPNPSNNKSFTLSFHVPEKGNVEIKIMDQLGLIAYVEKLDNFTGTYNKKIVLQNLALGIYFVDILRNENKRIIKLLLD